MIRPVSFTKLPDLPPQPADHVGPHGQAWRVDTAAILREQVAKAGKAPPIELQVCHWVVHAPYSHPIWPCVAVMCISLRDIEGWPPATILLEGATHEVMVAALEPDRPVRIDKPAAMLQPLNFAGQFIAASDEAARARIEETVRDICAGTLNPDTDNRRAWADRFSRSNAKPGFDTPDALVIGQGTALAVGTGAANVKALTDLVTTSATLAADERKPQ